MERAFEDMAGLKKPNDIGFFEERSPTIWDSPSHLANTDEDGLVDSGGRQTDAL